MNLTFKSTKQELPKDGEYILYIKNDKSMYYRDTPMPTFSECEWCWSDGDGSQSTHDEEYSLKNPPEDYPFLLILDGDGYIIWTNETNKWNPEIDHIWWIGQTEFDKIWNDSTH